MRADPVLDLSPIAPHRLAVDYVSPLPPVRSGIADYSADLLPRLEPLCDLRVIALAGQPVAEEVAARWQPAPQSETGRGGRLPLYQMGNNRYHEPVLRLALERSGVMTLHDLVLHHLLLDRTMGRGEFAPYAEELEHDHGWLGRAAAMPRRWGGFGDAAHFALPVHRSLLRRQRGVLVHSRWAADRIREEDPQIRVRAMPMGVPLPPPLNAGSGLELRCRLGIPEHAPLLGTFGFQTPIKRPQVAVAALARPELASAHLLVAGEVAPILDLDREARRLGVADRVHVTGFLEFADFEAAIAACDLCLNLRYPTAGETSASLLRVLAVGRAAVVSDYAQFAELPEDVVLKTPLGDDEVPQLAARVAELLGDRDRLTAMAAAARELVRTRHDPALAARALLAAAAEWADLDPPGEAPAQTPPPSSLTWHVLPGELEVEGADLPWAEGERRLLRVRLTNRGNARWLAAEEGVGGVALEVKLLQRSPGEGSERPWIPLPRTIDPGEAHLFAVEVRRPVGPGILRIEPQFVGPPGFDLTGVPVWERVF